MGSCRVHVKNGKRDNKCECSCATCSSKLNSLTEKIQAKTEAKTQAKTQAKKVGEKRRRKRQAKNEGEPRSENLQRKFQMQFIPQKESGFKISLRFSPQPSSQVMRLCVSSPANQGTRKWPLGVLETRNVDLWEFEG